MIFINGEIDWKSMAEQLLWFNIVSRKNEDSGFDILLIDVPERGMHKGDIGFFRILSYIGPETHKPLTWKELALYMGLFLDHLISDGHDCHRCPEECNCRAYFKYEKDQERCSGWERLKEEGKV